MSDLLGEGDPFKALLGYLLDEMPNRTESLITGENEYSKLSDYMRMLTGDPDLTVDSDSVYTRTWTSERIAAGQPTQILKAKAMKITLRNMQTGETTDLGESGIVSFDPEWSIDESHLDKSLWNWPATEYTVSTKMEWTAAGREWADGLIYGLKQEERQRIGRLLLDYVNSLTTNKPRGSRRAARRRLSKRRGKR